MQVICPKCHRSLDPPDVNPGTDVAYCAACAEAFSLSDLIASQPDEDIDLTRPPRGVWVEESFGDFTITASTRSLAAIFLVPFTLVWAGGSMGGIYGSQIVSGEFNVWLSLFGLPFLVGSAFLVGFTLLTLFGKFVIKVERGLGTAFLGVGTIGWRKRFDWSEITGAHAEQRTGGNDNTSKQFIVLEGPQRIKLPASLHEERNYFIVQFLRHQLRARR